MSSGPEWQFQIATDIKWLRMAFGRSTQRSTSRSTPLALTSSGPEWQFYIATNI